MAISSADKAKAAEALIRHPNLSPIARRLGLELLNLADKRKGICWPSEKRLALALGCATRSINRAKAELREAGLLSWITRGHHKTPVYRLAWETLKALGGAIKTRIRSGITPKAPSNFSQPTRAAFLSASIAALDSDPTFSSTNLTQTKDIKKEGALEGLGGPQTGKSVSQVELDRDTSQASARLWEGVRGRFPGSLLEEIFKHITADIESQALNAEQYRKGTGIQVLDLLLKQARGLS